MPLEHLGPFNRTALLYALWCTVLSSVGSGNRVTPTGGLHIEVVSATRPGLRQLLEQHCADVVQATPLAAPPILQHVLTSGVAGFWAMQLPEQQLMFSTHVWPLYSLSA
jgi:hypothetical protein